MIKCIEAAGKAGMRGINYNFCVLGHQSTESTKGRGGVSYRTFKLDECDMPTQMAPSFLNFWKCDRSLYP